MLQGADAFINGISDFNLNPAVGQVECGFWRRDQDQIAGTVMSVQALVLAARLFRY
jgi:hypothetical protein